MYTAGLDNPCPINDALVCKEQKCDKCGWNPEVSRERLESIVGEMDMADHKLYRVPFTGYCDVWAKSQEDAETRADNGEMFTVEYDFGTPICMEKEEKNELD